MVNKLLTMGVRLISWWFDYSDASDDQRKKMVAFIEAVIDDQNVGGKTHATMVKQMEKLKAKKDGIRTSTRADS